MDMENSTIASWVTLGSVIAGFLYQGWRAERQRKWDIEDRKALAKKVDDDATSIKDKVEEVASGVTAEAKKVASKLSTDAEDANRQRNKLMSAIQENTNISTEARDQASEAQKVANNMNKKIESLGISHNQIEREKVEEKKDSKRAGR